jgi:endonuclease/exonuclease/phosphatase family metal-dependent hydrolase
MLRIITWNIQWGQGIDGRVDLARMIGDAGKLADFDVLCLQEVSDNFSDLKGNSGENQFAALAALLPGYNAVEGVALDVPDGAGGRRRFGNMILSRLPVAQVLRYTLPWEAAPTRNMPRLLLEAAIETPSGPVRIMTTHLEYSSSALRRAQVEGIREAHRTACARVATPREEGPGTYALFPTSASAVLMGEAADLRALRGQRAPRWQRARRGRHPGAGGFLARAPRRRAASRLLLPLRAVERPAPLLRLHVRHRGPRAEDPPNRLRAGNPGLGPPAGAAGA